MLTVGVEVAQLHALEREAPISQIWEMEAGNHISLMGAAPLDRQPCLASIDVMP